jgi:FkbM family methyltransferase
MKKTPPESCRNPFTVTHVPGLAKLYLWAHNPDGLSFGSRLRRFLGQKLYRILRKTYAAPWWGSFRYGDAGREISIHFNARNTQFLSLYDRSYRYGYEIETSLALDSLADNDAVFYDIGSNWGHFSLLLASKPGYNGKIYAFEPFPSSFNDLQSTIGQAGLSGRITTCALAISDFDGESSMGVPDGIRSGLASLSSAGLPGGTPTKVAKLDSLDLLPPFLMKIDVEGNEARVIIGGSKTIAKNTPYIVFEHHRESIETSFTVFNELEKLGYLFYLPSLQFATATNMLRVTYGEDYAGLIDRYGKYSFCLVPMKVEERCLFPPLLNILAVHKRKAKNVKHLVPRKDRDSLYDD